MTSNKSNSNSYSRLALALFVAVLLFPARSEAQNIDVKQFDPVPGPHGILGVHTTRPLAHLSLWAGLTTSYANDLLVGHQGTIRTLRPVAHRMMGELALGLGLFSWVDVGVSLPVIFRQLGEDYPQAGDDSGKTGLGDLRLLVKGRILKNQSFSGFGLALVAELSAPTGPADAFMRNRTATFTPRLVLDYRHPRGYLVALNIGARFRGRQVVEDLAVGNELRLGLGAEAPLGPRGLSVLGEVVVAVGLAKPALPDIARVTARTTPMEALLAVRWRHRSGLALTTGAGVGLTDGYGAPDFRLLVTVGYALALKKGSRQPEPQFLTRRRAASPSRRVGHRPRESVGHRPRESVGHQPRESVGPKKISATDFDKAASRDPDPDADGIPTSRDKCPHQAEDMDGFEDTDGCPELDNDKDGIPDKHDKCPLKKEIINGVKDDDGCPDKGAAQIVLTGSKLKISQRIYFHTGSDRLKSTAFSILRQVAAFLRAHWRIRKVRIEGHTDSRGDKEKNVDLSVRRAYRVRAFLVARGVQAERLIAKGFGPKKPVASNRRRRGRARNRRVVFSVELVVKKGGAK